MVFFRHRRGSVRRNPHRHRWEEVVRAVDFIVVRASHTYTIPPGARVHGRDTVDLPGSSLKFGRHWRAVKQLGCLNRVDYIRANGLYLNRASAVRPER